MPIPHPLPGVSSSLSCALVRDSHHAVTNRTQKVTARPSWRRCVVLHTGFRCLSPRSAADPHATGSPYPRFRQTTTGWTAARSSPPSPTYRCRTPQQRHSWRSPPCRPRPSPRPTTPSTRTRIPTSSRLSPRSAVPRTTPRPSRRAPRGSGSGSRGGGGGGDRGRGPRARGTTPGPRRRHRWPLVRPVPPVPAGDRPDPAAHGGRGGRPRPPCRGRALRRGEAPARHRPGQPARPGPGQDRRHGPDGQTPASSRRTCGSSSPWPSGTWAAA